MNERNPLYNVNWYNPFQKKSDNIYVFHLKSTSVPDIYIVVLLKEFIQKKLSAVSSKMFATVLKFL